MNKLLPILLVVVLSGCSGSEYSSYNQCMKDEILKNNGKINKFIRGYCDEQFPVILKDVDYTFPVPSKVIYTNTETRKDKNKLWVYMYNGSKKQINSIKVFTNIIERDEKCNFDDIQWESLDNVLQKNKLLNPGERTWLVEHTNAIGPYKMCYTYQAISTQKVVTNR